MGRERLFPVKRAKAARRIEKRVVLLICAEQRVLLHKRDAQGLLAGLWEFPNLKGRQTRPQCGITVPELDFQLKNLPVG